MFLLQFFDLIPLGNNSLSSVQKTYLATLPPSSKWNTGQQNLSITSGSQPTQHLYPSQTHTNLYETVLL